MLSDPESPLSYILILVLILLSAFFAGSESAFSYCSRYRIRAMADDGKKRAKLSLFVLDRFDDTIITILIGTNIAHIVSSVIATLLMVKLMGDSGSILSTVIMTILVFMFGEILPKNIAKSNCDRWTLNSSFIIILFYYAFRPISFLFDGLIWAVKKIFRIKNDEESFTEDDFQDVIEHIEEEGKLDEEESDIIQAAVDFGQIKAMDILTKKEDIIALDINRCTPSYINRFLLEKDFSRIPVYKENIDNIIGILHVKRYLKELFLKKKINLNSNLIKPYFVSPDCKLDDLFEGFKIHKTHIAIVKDNDGKTIGMVTMKDVLEELVSDIDEADLSTDVRGVKNA